MLTKENCANNRQDLQEDEIDLREVASTIWKHRLKVAIFTAVVTMLTMFYTLSLPNEYESKALLAPQGKEEILAEGELAIFAKLVGVELSSDSASSIADLYNQLLNNYAFMRSFIIKNGIHKRVLSPNFDANYKFAFGFKGLYDLKGIFKKKLLDFDALSKGEQEGVLFELFSTLSKTIKVENKGAEITVSAKHSDAVLARDLVIMFIRDASNYLRQKEMLDNENKIRYYDEALAKTSDAKLKKRLDEVKSVLLQKKELMQLSEFYNVKLLIAPEVANPDNKAGPKRGLIIVVSFVTSLILAIFAVLFLDSFVKNSNRLKN